jgi:hemerythrin-like domain-containing protein
LIKLKAGLQASYRLPAGLLKGQVASKGRHDMTWTKNRRRGPHRGDEVLRLDLLVSYHAEQLGMCADLESMADRLPSEDPMHCRTLVTSFGSRLRVHHELEEERIFPLLERSLWKAAPLRIDLQRLVHEHGEDQDAVGDLSEELRSLSARDSARTTDAVAYQTRALFRSVRRHATYESEIVLPLAVAILSDRDLDALTWAYQTVL